MSDCCSLSRQTLTSARDCDCPQCGAPCKPVSHATVMHQLQRPWEQPPQPGSLYFCSSAACELVYFDAQGGRITGERLRQPVGQKQTGEERVLCYCFGASLGDWLRDPGVRAFVMAQTKAGVCACEIRNPSGRCCLGDFPQPEPSRVPGAGVTGSR